MSYLPGEEKKWREGQRVSQTKKEKTILEQQKKRILLKSNRKEAGIDCQLTFHIKGKTWSNPFSSSKKHHAFPVSTAVKQARFTQHKAQENKPGSHKVRGNHFTQLTTGTKPGQKAIGARSTGIAALVHQSISTLCQLQEIWGTDQRLTPHTSL